MPLTKLRKMYLSIDALCWADLRPADQEEGGKMGAMGEHWPGRGEICHQRDQVLIQRQAEAIERIGDDEGIFFLPVHRPTPTRLIEQAQQRLGGRCVVNRLGYETAENRRRLGTEFVKGLDQDRRQAEANRGPDFQKQWGPMTRQIEWDAWEHSKAWAVDLLAQLNANGYTFDPADVAFEAWGENWVGCGATYSCHMARVWDLAEPMHRPFDMFNADWSPMLMKAEPLEQGLELAEHVLLYIFKTAYEGPTWGCYVAQYWEGIHGIMDPVHAVDVDFPPDTVWEVDLAGWEIARIRGCVGPKYDRYGPMTMQAGCGAHTPYHSTVALAEQNISFEQFRDALRNGRVRQLDH